MNLYLLILYATGSGLIEKMLVISASVYMKRLAQQLNAVLGTECV